MASKRKGKSYHQGRGMVRTNIYLQPDVVAWAKEYAKEQKVTMTEVVRNAMEFYRDLPEDVRNPDPAWLQEQIEVAERMVDGSDPDEYLASIDERLARLEQLIQEKLG